MHYLIALFILFIFIMTVVWIGVYVALPLLLVCLVTSWIVSLIKMFLPDKQQASPVQIKQATSHANIIYVEYEEIK